MNYSIVKVKGLSMAPFLKDFDTVLVQNNNSETKVGKCYLHKGVIHRAINSTGTLKGDRLLYEDMHDHISQNKYLVIGRMIQERPLKVSYYGHPLLVTLSSFIALLSKYNKEKVKLRPFVLLLIIKFSKIHRFLEQFIVLRSN